MLINNKIFRPHLHGDQIPWACLKFKQGLLRNIPNLTADFLNLAI